MSLMMTAVGVSPGLFSTPWTPGGRMSLLWRFACASWIGIVSGPPPDNMRSWATVGTWHNWNTARARHVAARFDSLLLMWYMFRFFMWAAAIFWFIFPLSRYFNPVAYVLYIIN
jgi:hypothetical protein